MSFEGLLVHTCTIQKRLKAQKMTYAAGAGTPVVGMTITGATSHKTAVITRLFTGYLVCKDLSGTFTNGETIASGVSFSATLGTVTDYQNEQKEPDYYWSNDQSSVLCRFYHSGKNFMLLQTGEVVSTPLQCFLPSTVTLNDLYSYRIVTTEAGYEGTYDLTQHPRPASRTLHHYELVLTKVVSP